MELRGTALSILISSIAGCILAGDVVPECGPGEGLVLVRRNAHWFHERGQPSYRRCQLCPDGTYSAFNRMSELRLCEPCAVCDKDKQEVRKCAGLHDTICRRIVNSAPMTTPIVSLWNQKRFTESQAIAIVAGSAAILCGMMILVMVTVCVRDRCAQAQRARSGKGVLEPSERKPPQQKKVLRGYKGTNNIITVPLIRDKLHRTVQSKEHRSSGSQVNLLENEELPSV